jgi:hypothetical protein
MNHHVPSGSRQTNRSSDDVTVLEGVLYEDSVVYVTDILCWKVALFLPVTLRL